MTTGINTDGVSLEGGGAEIDGGGSRCAEVNGVHIDVLSSFQRTTIPCFFPHTFVHRHGLIYNP